MEEEFQPHKRRVRYNGTHPHSFNEKYKELNPEKYREDVQKIIDNGKTPAGMHIPIMVNEILDFLQIKPNEIGYDATLGYGGHTSKMLEKLEGKGRLFATDIDSVEIEKTKQRLAEMGFGEEILTIKKMNFADIDKVSTDQKFDFVLADLGVSSMQIDNPERGFSFKREGPLDLRLDPNGKMTAAERLKQITFLEFKNILTENSDEPYADQIAREVFRRLNNGKTVETTRELYDSVECALSFLPNSEKKETIKKSCQRVFQALRIEVNSEFEVLESFLEKLPNVLNSGARVAVLTFHSGEDRMVKKSFKSNFNLGVYSEVARDVVRPTEEECQKNSRARSTKMRWAIKS